MTYTDPRSRILLLPAAVAREAAAAALYGLDPAYPEDVSIALDPATRMLSVVTGEAANEYPDDIELAPYPMVSRGGKEDYIAAAYIIGWQRPLVLPGHPEIVGINSQCENYPEYEDTVKGEAALADLREILGLPPEWGALTINGATAYESLADADPAVIDAWVARHGRDPAATPRRNDALVTREDAEAVIVGYLAGDLTFLYGYRLFIEGVDEDYDRVRDACASGAAEITYDHWQWYGDYWVVYLPREAV